MNKKFLLLVVAGLLSANLSYPLDETLIVHIRNMSRETVWVPKGSRFAYSISNIRESAPMVGARDPQNAEFDETDSCGNKSRRENVPVNQLRPGEGLEIIWTSEPKKGESSLDDIRNRTDELTLLHAKGNWRLTLLLSAGAAVVKTYPFASDISLQKRSGNSPWYDTLACALRNKGSLVGEQIEDADYFRKLSLPRK